jgi:hypothetical protein
MPKESKAPHIAHLASEAGIDPFKNRYSEDLDGAFYELEDRYYPEASIFADPTQPVEEWPHYRIICKTPQELALVYALRPEGVSTCLVLDDNS